MLGDAIPHLATTLDTVGDWAAILAGAISVIFLVGAVGRRLRRWWTASELDHGLHLAGTPQLSDVRLLPAVGALQFRIGVNFRNGTARPLGYLPDVFTVRVGEVESPLAGHVRLEDIAPGDVKPWFRAPIAIPVPETLAKLTLEFSVAYGRRGRQFSRRLSGTWELELEAPQPGELPGQGALAAYPLRESGREIRDEPLPHSLRAAWRRLMTHEQRYAAATGAHAGGRGAGGDPDSESD